MKKSLWIRILSVVLIVSMIAPAASAASFGRTERNRGFGFSWFQNFWDTIRGRGEDRQPRPTQPVDPVPPETAAPGGPEVQLRLVEGRDTVENGDMLRAETYEVVSGAASMGLYRAKKPSTGKKPEQTTAEAGTIVKYFGSTLFNYDNRMNHATHQMELQENPNLNRWDGIYFTDGKDTAVEAAPDRKPVELQFNRQGEVENLTGEYILYSVQANAPLKMDVSGNNRDSLVRTNDWSKATVWKISKAADGGYYLQTGYRQEFLHFEDNKSFLGSESQASLRITRYEGAGKTPSMIELQNVHGHYLNQIGGETGETFGGYKTKGDKGNAFYLYPKQARESSAASKRAKMAPHNIWTGNQDGWNGNDIYSGLVQDSLTPDGQLVFNHPDAGVFNEDASVKDIYTKVGIPFVFTPEENKYTFDASQFGAYFDGAPTSSKNLHYSPDPQNTEALNSGDGRKTGWFPFNDTQVLDGRTVDYHFGMKTTIPFNMTANGRINPTEDRSAPITFSFSGDDDVWVFIDGQLVLDLGGIHNAIDGQMNFADNTWTITANSAQAAHPTIDVAGNLLPDKNDELTGKIFSDGTGKSRLHMDRETFAATENHELTIFYLERGKGSSNCKIEFNLPMLDTVAVYKQVTESWTSTGDGEGTTQPLTAEEQATVDNIDFGFTLYKRVGNGFQPVANTKYSLMNSDGQVISVPSTDSHGHFTLRNGQAARFNGGISTEGSTYYVAEDYVNNIGFVAPDYFFSGEAAGGYDVNGAHYSKGIDIPRQILRNLEQPGPYESHQVCVTGADEARDSLVFVCRNYLDASLPETSVNPVDDRIVIDYGLGVDIDVLGNDLHKGDTFELIEVAGRGLTVDAVTGGHLTEAEALRFGTARIMDGGIRYQLDKPMTGVEELTYVVKATSEKILPGGGTGTTEAYGTAKVYIIPATTMYYEENFGDGFVSFAGSGWTLQGSADNELQEPGVVGTVADSPYGSDIAYLHDGADSNGTSYYVSTVNGPAHFRYTFTGTETSFFARTTNNTGNMKITITDEAGQTIYTGMRDTVYKDAASDVKGPLYNVPVFTWSAEQEEPGRGYGTYTVTVSIAKGGKFGSDFWLDGIRVVNPLDPDDVNADIARSAYAADGESNMTHATLRDKLLSEAQMEFVFQLDENGEFMTDEYGERIPVLDENDEPVIRPVWDEETQKFLLFTDVDGAMETAESYRSIGPKEELYLYSGQKVTFSLKNWDPNTNKLFIGMKSPKGSAGVQIGSHSMTIENAADCFYDISNYGRITAGPDNSKIITFEITADAGSLLSLTNLKVTGNAEFTIVEPNLDLAYESGM